MREAAVTVNDAGVEPRMASAAAEVQAWVAALRAAGVFEGAIKDRGFRELSDRVRGRVRDQRTV